MLRGLIRIRSMLSPVRQMAPSSSPAERETDRALYSLGAFMALKHFLGSQSAPRHTDAAHGRGGLFVSLQRAAAWEKTSRHSISRRGPLPPLARGPCSGPAGMHTSTDARAGSGQEARGSVARVRATSPQCLQLRQATSTTAWAEQVVRRFRTAHNWSDLKALFQVVLCSL